jgi:hypothetical protein
MNSTFGAAICCLLFALTAAAQENAPLCKDLSYANRNQIDYGPLRVAAVRGTAKDAQGVAIPRACVGVFAETGHKLIAETLTDGDGNFELKGVPPGDYRLVVKCDGLSPANAELRIEPSRGKKTLVVQLRPAGLDTGSFVEVK